MSFACWIIKAIDNTVRLFNIYCSSQQKRVRRTRPKVTLHVHCLSCL